MKRSKRLPIGEVTCGRGGRSATGMADVSGRRCFAVVAIAVLFSHSLYATALPAGYEEVEYIDSDGKEYVDLGFPSESDHRYLLTVAAINVSSNVKMFGAYTAKSAGVYVGTASSLWSVGYTPTKYSCGSNQAGGMVYGKYLPAIHDIRVADYDSNYKSGVYYFNNHTDTDGIFSGGATALADQTLILFGARIGGTVTPGVMRFFSLRMYNSDNTLVHDFIPVVDGDDAPGVYDLVTSTFIAATVTTAGGVLTAGPKVSLREIKNTRTSETYSTIEDAITAAEAGDTITLKPYVGTYRLTTARAVIDKGVTLRGTGTSPDEVVITPMANYDMYHFRLNHADARLENVTLTGAWSGYYNSWDSGAGQLLVDAGTVSNCVVRDISGKMWAGPVRLNGGVMTDSLVENNSNSGQPYSNGGVGGGVCLYNKDANSAVVENCTIVNNTSQNLLGSGLYMIDGTVRNSIIHSNGDPASDVNCNVNYAGGTFDYNIYAPDKSLGSGNIVGDPGFKNTATGDYSLGAGSAAIDAAYDYGSSVTNDFNGSVRPKQGRLDSAEAVNDIGAWEAMGVDEGDFRASATVQGSRSGLGELTITCTASLAGHGMLGEVSYVWSHPGGERLSTSADGSEITVKYSDYGKFDVTLYATNSYNEGDVDTIVEAAAVGAKKVYVDLNGANNWPYATKADAATDIMTAVNSLILVDGETIEIVVGDGVYPVSELWVRLTSPIYLHSENGPEATTLMAASDAQIGGNPYKRVVNVAHAGAVVEGFTMTGGNCFGNTEDGAGPGALKMTAGTVRNCVIRDNTGSDDSGGVDLRGGTLENCVIKGNKAYRGNNNDVGKGGGISIYGDDVKVIGCTIENNEAGKIGGGVYVETGLDGVIVSNCVFRGNSQGRYSCNGSFYSGWNGAAIYALSGEFRDLVITGNVAKAYVSGDNAGLTGEAAVHLSGTARLVNSLVAKNKSAWGAQGVLLNGADASIVNCTITDNGSDDPAFYKAADSIVASRLTAGTVYNTIIWKGAYDPVTVRTGATGDHNLIDVDPLLRGCGDQPYLPTARSVAINGGDNSAWGESAASAHDLKGGPRLLDGVIDIGCYERRRSGFVILVQ